MSDKTIKMPKPLLDEWLAALRSGKYAKGEDFLKFEDSEGCERYCCLGVLQEIKGGVEESENGDDAPNVPTLAWWERHGVTITPPVTGRPDRRTPFIPSEGSLLTSINDAVVYKDGAYVPQYTFNEIADMIERHTETY